MTRYFGTRWNFAFTELVETPLGAECFMCGELVDVNDSGTFSAVYTQAGGVTDRAIHLECHLRSVLGSWEHQTKRCSCYGGTEPTESYRDQARRVMAFLLEGQ